MSLLMVSGAYGRDEPVVEENNAGTNNERRERTSWFPHFSVNGGWDGLGRHEGFAPKNWHNKLVCFGPGVGATPVERTLSNLRCKAGILYMILLYKAGKRMFGSKDKDHHKDHKK